MDEVAAMAVAVMEWEAVAEAMAEVMVGVVMEGTEEAAKVA